jgi:precorrin-6B methylase 2
MAKPSDKGHALIGHFIGGYAGAFQMDHRIDLIAFWNIKPGSRILELGCGQGDCTIALADAVGPDGHIDAVDPGSPDYGELLQ